MHERSLPHKAILNQLQTERILQICYEKTAAVGDNDMMVPGRYKKAIQYGYEQGYLSGNLEITAAGRAIIKATVIQAKAVA